MSSSAASSTCHANPVDVEVTDAEVKAAKQALHLLGWQDMDSRQDVKLMLASAARFSRLAPEQKRVGMEGVSSALQRAHYPRSEADVGCAMLHMLGWDMSDSVKLEDVLQAIEAAAAVR